MDGGKFQSRKRFVTNRVHAEDPELERRTMDLKGPIERKASGKESIIEVGAKIIHVGLNFFETSLLQNFFVHGISINSIPGSGGVAIRLFLWQDFQFLD